MQVSSCEFHFWAWTIPLRPDLRCRGRCTCTSHLFRNTCGHLKGHVDNSCSEFTGSWKSFNCRRGIRHPAFPGNGESLPYGYRVVPHMVIIIFSLCRWKEYALFPFFFFSAESRFLRQDLFFWRALILMNTENSRNMKSFYVLNFYDFSASLTMI